MSGRLLVPRHRACHAALPWPYRLREAWPLNGPAFWLVWTAGTVALVVWAMAAGRDELWYVLAAFEVGTLVPRLVSWLAYERHLPNDP